MPPSPSPGDRETLLRELADAIPQIVWTAGPDGLLTHVNARGAEYAGRPSGELHGQAWVEAIHPDDLPVAFAAKDDAVRTGAPREFEFRLRRADGVYRWHVSRQVPKLAADGTVAGWFGTCTDIDDLKQVQHALRDTEARLAESQRVARLGSWRWHPGPDEVWWSGGEYDLLGATAATVVPSFQAFLMRLHPDDRPRAIARIDEMRAGLDESADDLRLLGDDGAITWIHSRARATRDAAGVLIRVDGTDQDITDRKHTESALQASEQRHRRLMDVLPTAVLVHDGERVLYCNPAFVRMVGASSADDVLARRVFDCVHPDDQALVRDRLAGMLASSEAPQGTEIRLRHRDGRPVPTHSITTPITGYGPQAYLIALSDLTERERATQLLRTVLGSVSDAILTIDAHGIVQSANEAAARQFGRTADTLIGANVRTLMPEPHRSRHDDYIAHYLATGDAKVIGIGREVEGQRHDGTRFPAELTVTEFTLDGERRFTGVLRDISARKRLEDQFRQAQKMEAVGRLAGGVAHDFNNLLTVINMYCEVLLSSPLADDDQRESVAAIRDAGERASRLTQQLLAFGRKAILEPKVLDLNELVTESARLLRRLLGEDIILMVRESPRPVRVKADPTQLEQVIMNLAVNARDAMPTGGRLTIESSIGPADGGSGTPVARLTVADTGHGMTEEVRRQIFEPFFTTKGVGKGTGLGLSVVDGAIAQCGGGISVESTVDVGTTFRLWLPLAAAEHAADETAPAAIAGRGAETVLIVEDDDAVRAVVRLALTMQGFTVLEAASGAAAVRMAAAHAGDIALLVSDVVMPEMGGRQVLEAVREHRPGVRALFMSGYTDDSVLRHGVVESADAFIQKPFTPLGLARKVRQVIDGTGA